MTDDPPCERCGDAPVSEVVDSPVIPWSGMGLCESCHEDYQNGDVEVTATVTKMT